MVMPTRSLRSDSDRTGAVQSITRGILLKRLHDRRRPGQITSAHFANQVGGHSIFLTSHVLHDQTTEMCRIPEPKPAGKTDGGSASETDSFLLEDLPIW